MRKNQLREEATRALLHAEQRQMLAERLSTDFQHRMQGKEVPEFVQRFLCGPWAQALAESQLVSPAQGDEAAAMDGVADDLIWSAQPALIRRDAERLLKLVPRPGREGEKALRRDRGVRAEQRPARRERCSLHQRTQAVHTGRDAAGVLRPPP